MGAQKEFTSCKWLRLEWAHNGHRDFLRKKMLRLIRWRTYEYDGADKFIEELLRTIRFSNKILMMVNLVNIATILVILVMIT